ncbi:aldehyde dehydrogenase family protein [Pseudonocardia sichuanensis]
MTLIDYSRHGDAQRVETNRVGGHRMPADAAMEVRNPATGEVLAAVPASDEAAVSAAVGAARDAAPAWAAAPPQERSRVLGAWADLLVEHRNELSATATAEMGKLLGESQGEVDRAVAEIRFMAGEALRLNGETFPSAVAGTTVYSTRVPVGVVAAITPWNFPVVSPVRKIGPALATGNTVVCKPAAESPLTALALTDLLEEAGLPAGVLNTVCGGGSTGAALVGHAGVDAVSFTGSTAVGRAIAEVAGRRLVPVQLELGGKNAIYVDASADLDRAVPEIVSAAVQTSGQRCTAISRVLAHRAIADELVQRLADAYDALPVGAGTDPAVEVGPLVSAKQKERVAGYLRGSQEEGAVVATCRTEVPDGNYVAPVVLDQVVPSMTVAREEVFGPVLSVIRVEDLDEAIEVTNDCEYGLAAAVFASDVAAALEFSQRAEVGMVHVNHGTASQPYVPFGGVASSGMGAYSIGSTAREFFTRLKVVYLRG